MNQLCIYIYPVPLESPSHLTPIPSLWVITEPRAELPMLALVFAPHRNPMWWCNSFLCWTPWVPTSYSQTRLCTPAVPAAACGTSVTSQQRAQPYCLLPALAPLPPPPEMPVTTLSHSDPSKPGSVRELTFHVDPLTKEELEPTGK